MLFSDIIFGPVKSRRLGLSLGINLLPVNNKRCNFDCLYCECGWTHTGRLQGASFFPTGEILEKTEERLQALAFARQIPDVLTFAGNGEPTMHPDFDLIMEGVITLRNRYMPGVKICVLSNSLLASRPRVFGALLRADRRIMKLDAGNEATFDLINRPNGKHQFGLILKTLQKFNGQLEIQTIFFSGEFDGQRFDNSSATEVNSWLACLDKIRPQLVQLYTLDRETPASLLHKVSHERMSEIAGLVKNLGIRAEVY